MYSELLENSVIVPDQTTQQLGKAAKRAGIHVVIGINERNIEGSNTSLFNTLLYFDGRGNLIGKHRKLIPTGNERLIWAQGDGGSFHAYDTSIGKLGGLICWENYMPLARYAMYAWGVQIHCAPTWDSSESWVMSLRHVAREGGMYVLGVCSAIHMEDIPGHYEFKKLYPTGREWINIGRSCIIHPKGDIIAGPILEKKELCYADIDLQETVASKWIFDAAGHYARPDVFQFRINQKAHQFIQIDKEENTDES
jgi:nitrilase